MTDPLPSSWAAEEPTSASPKRRWPWIVGAVVLLGAVAVAAFVVLSREADKDWPETAGGRPAGLGEEGQAAADVDPTADPGIYVWNSFDGWHLWVVNGDAIDGVSGTITSTDEPSKAVLSTPDAGSVAIDGKAIAFELPGDVPVAGVDFEPGFYGEELTIELEGANGVIAAADVTVGADGKAEAVPVVIEKE